MHMYNTDRWDYTIGAGERFVQFLVQRYATPTVVLVESLPATHRGDGGIGSTGQDEPAGGTIGQGQFVADPLQWLGDDHDSPTPASAVSAGSASAGTQDRAD